MANLNPSTAARRVACPGSFQMEQQFPREESESAREGTLAHKASIELLYLDGKFFSSENKAKYTQEMIEGAQLYYKDIFNCVGKVLNNVEYKINISNIHPNCKGVIDYWHFEADKGNLWIWDYKFGHKAVEVYENWQLIEYAAGLVNELEIDGIQDNFITVYFTIVQPRAYHKDGFVRRWTVNLSKLRPYFNVLEQAEWHATQPKAVCIPSPECNYCAARHACKALQSAALTAVDTNTDNTPFELTNEQLGNELRLLKHTAELLNARITGLEEQACFLIKSGKSIPHFGLEQTFSREQWAKPIEEILILGELCGVDLKKPTELITPKQAIDIGLPEELAKQNSQRIPGKLKLKTVTTKEVNKLFEE